MRNESTQQNIEIVTTESGKFYSFTGDKDTLSLKQFGPWSAQDADIASRFIRDGDIVFDIGANIGALSILFASKAGKTGHIYSFEAYPETFSILQKNIRLNQRENMISPILGVVSDDNVGYRAHLIHHNDVIKHGSTYFLPSDKWDAGDAGAIILDEWCGYSRIKKVDFIKIDVEGMELSVLRGGGRKILETYKSVLYLEICEVHLQKHGVAISQIEHLLGERGYHFFRYFGGKGCNLHRLFRIAQGSRFYNLLAVHPSDSRYPKSHAGLCEAFIGMLFEKIHIFLSKMRGIIKLRTRIRNLFIIRNKLR